MDLEPLSTSRRSHIAVPSYDVELLATSVEFLSNPGAADERAVIVIDVLRNTSCICIALAQGVKQVHIYGKGSDSVDALRSDRATVAGPTIAAGEINGYAVEGFELGNCPRDFATKHLEKTTVFFASTNNGRVLHALAKDARPRSVVLGTFLNADAIVTAVSEGSLRPPFLFVCAGFHGRVALEDIVCAGTIIDRCMEHFSELTMDDAALMAVWSSRTATSAESPLVPKRGFAETSATWRCPTVLRGIGHEHDVMASFDGSGLPVAVVRLAARVLPTVAETIGDVPIIVDDARRSGTPGDS